MPSTRKRASRKAEQPERRVERQRSILSAAVRAFSRYGYHACTVSRIAREAGVADGTLYLYFQGKEDLLVRSFRFVLDGMLAEMDARVAPASDPVEKLRLAAEFHLECMERDPDLARFLQFQLRQPDEAIRKEIGASLANYARRIEAFVEDGKRAGVFRSGIPARVFRRVYLGAVDETVSAWLLRPEGGSLKARAAPLLDVLLNGMLAR